MMTWTFEATFYRMGGYVSIEPFSREAVEQRILQMDDTVNTVTVVALEPTDPTFSPRRQLRFAGHGNNRMLCSYHDHSANADPAKYVVKPTTETEMVGIISATSEYEVHPRFMISTADALTALDAFLQDASASTALTWEILLPD